MKYIYSQAENKFETSQFVVTTEQHKQIALTNGYVEVTDEDYEKLVNHELCWENGVLVPYTKTYEEMTAEQQQARTSEIQSQIDGLKLHLANTDYQAIKFAEGEMSEEEYEPMKAQRKAWREEINRLELELQYKTL